MILTHDAEIGFENFIELSGFSSKSTNKYRLSWTHIKDGLFVFKGDGWLKGTLEWAPIAFELKVLHNGHKEANNKKKLDSDAFHTIAVYRDVTDKKLVLSVCIGDHHSIQRFNIEFDSNDEFPNLNWDSPSIPIVCGTTTQIWCSGSDTISQENV